MKTLYDALVEKLSTLDDLIYTHKTQLDKILVSKGPFAELDTSKESDNLQRKDAWRDELAEIWDAIQSLEDNKKDKKGS
jgi:hypothetical protein